MAQDSTAVSDIDHRNGDGQITVKRLSRPALFVSIRRVQHLEELRYRKLQIKGVLLEKDLRHRLHYTRLIKWLGMDAQFRKEGVSFYLDSTGFVH